MRILVAKKAGNFFRCMWEYKAKRVLASRKFMSSDKPIRFFLAAVFAVIVLAAPGFVRAQAPPGPLPQAQSQDPPVAAKPAPPPVKPRTSIIGAWKLDKDDSDDPRQKMQQARGSSGNGGYGGRRGGLGGNYPGGGIGGGSRGGGQSDDDREHMQEFVQPSSKLTLTQKDAEVDVADDQYRTLELFTDGRKLQKSKDLATQEIAAHWEDKSLVTDEKNPRGGKMSRTFELSPDGTQLYETLHLTVGKNGSPIGIRYVYDQVQTSQPAAPETKK